MLRVGSKGRGERERESEDNASSGAVTSSPCSARAHLPCLRDYFIEGLRRELSWFCALSGPWD